MAENQPNKELTAEQTTLLDALSKLDEASKAALLMTLGDYEQAYKVHFEHQGVWQKFLSTKGETLKEPCILHLLLCDVTHLERHPKGYGEGKHEASLDEIPAEIKELIAPLQAIKQTELLIAILKQGLAISQDAEGTVGQIVADIRTPLLRGKAPYIIKQRPRSPERNSGSAGKVSQSILMHFRKITLPAAEEAGLTEEELKPLRQSLADADYQGTIANYNLMYPIRFYAYSNDDKHGITRAGSNALKLVMGLLQNAWGKPDLKIWDFCRITQEGAKAKALSYVRKNLPATLKEYDEDSQDAILNLIGNQLQTALDDIYSHIPRQTPAFLKAAQAVPENISPKSLKRLLLLNDGSLGPSTKVKVSCDDRNNRQIEIKIDLTALFNNLSSDEDPYANCALSPDKIIQKIRPLVHSFCESIVASQKRAIEDANPIMDCVPAGWCLSEERVSRGRQPTKSLTISFICEAEILLNKDRYNESDLKSKVDSAILELAKERKVLEELFETMRDHALGTPT